MNRQKLTDHNNEVGFDALVIQQANHDLFGEMPIRTVSFDEQEIITNIINLYLDKDSFDLDPTYSKGVFWRGLKQPKFKYDVDPQIEGVLLSDCRSLPISNAELSSIMFDPPFIVGINSDDTKTGIINKRFSAFRDVAELWQFYKDSLAEFYRILKANGVLVIKCQDTVSSGKQYLSHIYLVNEAVKLGFYARDLFVYVVKDRIIDPKHKNQQHARKFHSYYLVFEKKKVKVDYGLAV